jgi:hypothetical protein
MATKCSERDIRERDLPLHLSIVSLLARNQLTLYCGTLIVWETQVQLVTSQVVTPYPTTFVGSGSKIRFG